MIISDCTGESTFHTVKAVLRRAGVGGSSSQSAIHLRNYCESEASVADAVEFAASVGALAVVGSSDGGACDGAAKRCDELGGVEVQRAELAR